MVNPSLDDFERSMLPHLDAAYNLARWLSGNCADADDIVQEAYLRALRFFPRYEEDNPRAWLLTIVRNAWIMQWRRRERGEGASSDEPVSSSVVLDGWSDNAGQDPECVMVRRQDVALVRRALASLPVEFREVLILREMEDMSYKDVASIVGIPIGTVMSRLARARRGFGAAVRSEIAGQGAANMRLVPRNGSGSTEVNHGK